MQNRREFIGHLAGGAATVALGSSAFILEGCNSTDVWHQIEAWLPMGIDAFDSILSIVAPIAAPGIEAIAALVKAGFATLSAAIDDYLNAPAADKATWAQKIKLILKEVGDNMQKFLDSINQTSSPLIKIIAALVGVLVNVIAGFINKIPGVAGAFRAEFHVAGQIVMVNPALMDRKAFIAAFNEVCNANSRPDLRIPRKP